MKFFHVLARYGLFTRTGAVHGPLKITADVNISRSVMSAAKSDLIMFSHQIPAFRLTNDNLCGYWELDPASVPEMNRGILPMKSTACF